MHDLSLAQLGAVTFLGKSFATKEMERARNKAEGDKVPDFRPIHGVFEGTFRVILGCLW